MEEPVKRGLANEITGPVAELEIIPDELRCS